MPTATIFFSEEEDKKITRIANKWQIAKYQAVRRMVRDYPEESVKESAK